jgi:hypothetical protein
LKNITILLLNLLICSIALGQTITERLILTDKSKDSLYLNARHKFFDNDGYYCFVTKLDNKEYFITQTDTIGGFGSIQSTYGNGGEMLYIRPYSVQRGNPWYYQNAQGVKVYGSAVGELRSYNASNTRENMAVTTATNDSVYYYINGKLVSSIHIRDADNFYIRESDWCAFSENGHAIYFIKRDSSYLLYANGKLIDSSGFRYTQLAINDSGYYIFAKGNKPQQKIGRYDYMFFIHSKDTTLGYARTVWNYELKNTGAYYYSGDDNGSYYIAINDMLYKGMDYVTNITLIDRKTYLYTFGEQGQSKINAGGKIYTYSFDEIRYPALDKKGNFTCYGLKDYYLYKYINGKQTERPISNYGVRATPLYISPEGASLHYFKTDDSIYLYKDDQLLFRPISKNSGLKVTQFKDIFLTKFIKGQSQNCNSLFYMEYDSIGYWVFNGLFSKPMIPVRQNYPSDTVRLGEIIAGRFDDNGFFSIQRTGISKYLVNLNNKVYKEVDNIDTILYDDYFFDGRELIFYATKGLSFYQFKLTL